MGYEIWTSVINSSTAVIPFNENFSPGFLAMPSSSSSASVFLASRCFPYFKREGRRIVAKNFKPQTFLYGVPPGPHASNLSAAQVEEQEEIEIAKGYSMTQFCDEMIDLFLNEKTKSKE